MDGFLTRPFGLAALALPVLVWWWARSRARPREVPISTLRFWRQDDAEGPAPRARTGVDVWLLVLGLAVGAATLAGPGRLVERPPVPTFVVDRSASMGLPHDPAAPAGPTRYARAVALARTWIEGEGLGAVAWTALVGGRWRTVSGSAPPARWAVLDEPEAELPFDALDRADHVWVTDRARPAQRAGLVASGGAAVPGSIGSVQRADGRRTLVFDGASVALEAGARAGACWIGPRVPVPIRAATAVWADVRGLALVDRAERADVLRVVGAPATARAAGSFALRGDGWTLAGPLAPLAPAGTLVARWTADRSGAPAIGQPGGSGVDAVRAGRGRVQVAFGPEARLAGDAARFAVELASLCDRAARPPAGHVPLAERRAAGPADVRPPRVAGAAGPVARRLEATGSALAAALVGAALVSGRWRRRRSSPRARPRSRARSADRSGA